MAVKQLPVFNRKNIVKNFELLTKQEILRYHNTIAGQNERLSGFEKTLKVLFEDMKDKIKVVEKYCLDTKKICDEYIADTSPFDSIHKKISDLDNLCVFHNNEIMNILLKLEKLSDKDSVESSIIQLKEEISVVKDDIINNHDFLEKKLYKLAESIFSLEFNMNELIRDVKKSLKDQDDKINILEDLVKKSQINSEWAKRDMKQKQKGIFVLEKKFEYLDDKIKKLQEKSN